MLRLTSRFSAPAKRDSPVAANHTLLQLMLVSKRRSAMKVIVQVCVDSKTALSLSCSHQPPLQVFGCHFDNDIHSLIYSNQNVAAN